MTTEATGTLEDTVVGIPRSNGELVFEQPWESRAFGIAAALADQGLFPWKDFQENLIAEVARRADEPGEYSYYDRWLGAHRTLHSGALIADRGGLTTTFALLNLQWR